MHQAAFHYVAGFGNESRLDVLDIGGRDINGSCRPLFPNATYTAIDLYPGPGVDVVGDAAEWKSRRRFDLVLCTEVLEHAEDWPALVRAAFRLLRPGGRAVVTCAGPGRSPHSASDGGDLRHGEWYRNVTAGELAEVLTQSGFVHIDSVEVGAVSEDVQATAVKP